MRTVKTGSGIIREEKTTDLMPDEYDWFRASCGNFS